MNEVGAGFLVGPFQPRIAPFGSVCLSKRNIVPQGKKMRPCDGYTMVGPDGTVWLSERMKMTNPEIFARKKKLTIFWEKNIGF